MMADEIADDLGHALAEHIPVGSIGIGISPDNTVILAFGRPTDLIALKPLQAISFAKALTERALEAMQISKVPS